MIAQWLCSCSTEPNSIYKLNICAKCHRVSCNWCQKPELLVKYCPGCFRVAGSEGQLRCIHNCLECPRCELNLSISMEKLINGFKRFEMVCNGCKWRYKTPEVGVLRTLTGCVEELEKNEDAYTQRFNSLREFYRIKRGLQTMEEGGAINESIASKELFDRLNETKLYKMINEERPIGLGDAGDAGDTEETTFPHPLRLRAKFDFRCPSCGEWLTKSHPDPKSSRLLLESFAAHMLPSLEIVPRSEVEPSVSDKNAMALVFTASDQSDAPVEITILGSATIQIPVRQFTLTFDGPVKRESTMETIKRLVRRVPTYQLNSSTNILATEKSRRLSRPETVAHKDNMIDQGSGWCIIPMYILEPATTHRIQLTIPVKGVYVTLQAVLH
ncbi:LAQU0S08e01288g1_1 [Lachancea quebecensis]|uniref:Dynactin subunit 4 n=1 Tax=Lachancea quebecensis TaxID=1654605 RepID=A0A0P1KT21_9SACH|nr:LAQU0S08e01288g1_1 [Lachancea quebecensis]